MKNFSKQLFLIACILVIFQMISGCDSMQKMYESRNDSQLAKTRLWPERSVPQKGAKCRLSTSWRDGRMYYIFRTEPLVGMKEADNTGNKSPEFAAQAFMSKSFIDSLNYRYSMPIFTVKLVDSGGFVIMAIEMNDAIRIVDNDSNTIGLEQKSNTECSRDSYQTISGWELAWR